MRVLVTGHNGYIGSVLVPSVEAAGPDVVGVDSDLFAAGTRGDAVPEVEARVPFAPDRLTPGERRVAFDTVEIEDISDRHFPDRTEDSTAPGFGRVVVPDTLTRFLP